jgi:hypothetical protein
MNIGEVQAFEFLRYQTTMIEFSTHHVYVRRATRRRSASVSGELWAQSLNINRSSSRGNRGNAPSSAIESMDVGGRLCYLYKRFTMTEILQACTSPFTGTESLNGRSHTFGFQPPQLGSQNEV